MNYMLNFARYRVIMVIVRKLLIVFIFEMGNYYEKRNPSTMYSFC